MADVAIGRSVVLERDGNATRIHVPMIGPYVPIPDWIGLLDILALVVAPLWWLGTLLIRTLLRLPKPPRAVVEITDEHLTLTLRDQTTGELTKASWPRDAIVEARLNRFERGLWLHIAGHVQNTYLQDLPADVLDELVMELQTALGMNPDGSRTVPNRAT